MEETIKEIIKSTIVVLVSSFISIMFLRRQEEIKQRISIDLEYGKDIREK